MLVQIVNNAPPTELENQIREHTGLSPDQAKHLAQAILAHEKLAKEVAEMEAKGIVVDVPAEFPEA